MGDGLQLDFIWYQETSPAVGASRNRNNVRGPFYEMVLRNCSAYGLRRYLLRRRSSSGGWETERKRRSRQPPELPDEVKLAQMLYFAHLKRPR
jgi:hypothetical protein